MSSNRFLGLALIFSLFLFIIYQEVKAAVDLVSFTAIAHEDYILVEWETATEIDNAGFYVTRDTDPVPPFEPISGFIPAEGSGVIGAQYEFLDDEISNGEIYYYILEAVDTHQNIDMHGPISVTFGSQVTNTPTVSSTSTRTPGAQNTATPTRSPTPTKTRTPAPGKTATLPPPTFTPTSYTETPTHTVTPSHTPSPTLFEAPEIVLIQPSTTTPSPTIETRTPIPSLTPTPKGRMSQMMDSGSLVIISVICLVILVWLAVAIGVFIYIQKRLN